MFYVHFSMTTMGKYTDAPKKGHLGAMIKIFGYLKHHIKFQIICDAVLLEYQRDFDLDINWS